MNTSFFDKKENIIVISIILGVLLIGSVAGTYFIARSLNQQSQASLQQTQIAQTLAVRLTENVYQTAVAQITEQSSLTPMLPVTGADTATAQSALPTALSPSATAVPASATPVPPTATQLAPTATRVPATSTSVPAPCSAALLVKDVTVPDGTTFFGGATFTKTWRLKNVGTCTWNSDTDIVFSSGNAMNGPAVSALSKTVKPGETIDLSVNLRSSTTAGTYTGYWMLRDSGGRLFGLGPKADEPFWVTIKVRQFTSDDVPASRYPLDFTAKICDAEWKSATGSVSLPCKNTKAEYSAWAAVLMNPKFEDGHVDDEATIWMHPDDNGGWVRGTYPLYTVQDGDHFRAWIGCLYNNPKCDVIFSLDYKLDGTTYELGSWREIYDGKVRKLDIDLSKLKGKSVNFILRVDHSDTTSGDANAFWFVPSVQHKAAATATATPLPTATATATATPIPTATQTPTSVPTPDASAAITGAKLTLSTALSVDPSALTANSAVYTEWANTCLELPTSGEVCAPSVVPGFRILLSMNSRSFEAHTNLDGLTVRWFEN